MTTHPPRSASPVADALATALAGDSAAHGANPSQLRSRLTRLLGDEAHAHRGDVHLVVTALDENVPSELRMAAPLTAADVARHADALAQARGWTQEAALRAVRYWAEAMNLPVSGDPAQVLPAASLPGSLSTSERSDPAAPGAADADERTAVPDAAPRGRTDDGTNVPDEAETVLPRRDDPNATELPDRSSVVAASMLTPATASRATAAAPTSAATPVSQPQASGPVPWPSSPKAALGAALPKGVALKGAYWAVRGGHPMLRLLTMAAFTAVVFLAIFLVPISLVRMLVIGVGASLVFVVATRLVRSGIMIVDDAGLAWFQSAPQPGPVELAVGWQDVTLVPGNPPRLRTPSGVIWVKKRKGLLSALESRVQHTEERG